MTKGQYKDKNLYILLIIYFIAVLSRYLPSVFPIRVMSIIICCIAVVFWMMSINRRLIERRQRNLLYGISVLLLFLHLSQLCKYNIFTDVEPVERVLWYSYYIPLCLIPLLSLYVALRVGRQSQSIFRPHAYLLYFPCMILISLVITNDYHQLFFKFNEGFVNWNSDYSHEFLFYVMQAWIYILTTVSFIIVQWKSYKRIPFIQNLALIFVIIMHYVLTIILFSDAQNNFKINGIVPITMPMLCNMTFVLAWELHMHFGLIQSNSDYSGIFDISGIEAVITDLEGKQVLRSGASRWKIPEQLKSASSLYAVMLDEKRKLYGRNISGGRIWWVEDISTINDLNIQLKDNLEALRESNEMLVEEAGVKAKQAKLMIQNSIYDEITDTCRPVFKRIESCLNEVDSLSGQDLKDKLTEICILGVYIERYSNLVLTLRSSGVISIADLQIAVKEMLEYAFPDPKLKEVSVLKGEKTENYLITDAYRIIEVIILATVNKADSASVLIDSGNALIIRSSFGIKEETDKTALLEELRSIGHKNTAFSSYYVDDSEDDSIDVGFTMESGKGTIEEVI